MTEKHDVTISGFLALNQVALVQAACSCGEILSDKRMQISVDEANNLKWQHLVKHMPALEDVPVHGSCDSPECKWCHIQPPSYYLREI